MATQKSQNGNRSSLVYWAIGITALIGIVFILWPKEENNIALRGTINLSTEGREVVNNYLTWVQNAAIKEMDVSHDLAAQGLRELAVALHEMTESTSAAATEYARPRIDTIKSAANQLSAKPQSLNHSDLMKNAFSATRDVLLYLQKPSFPLLDAQLQKLETQISSIRKDEMFLNQKTEILNTHKQIAAIVREMTEVGQ